MDDARYEALRRELLIMRIAGGVMAFITLVCLYRTFDRPRPVTLVSPNSESRRTDEVIKAKAFVVVDKDGKEWARLGKHPTYPGGMLDLCAAEEYPALSLRGGPGPSVFGRNPDKDVSFDLHASDVGTAILTFHGDDLNNMLSLGVWSVPFMQLESKKEKHKVVDFFDQDGKPLMTLRPYPGR